MLPPCGVSTTSREDFSPGCDALGRFAKESFRTGTGVGVVLVPELGVCEYDGCVGFGLAGEDCEEEAATDGDGVAARAAEAVPLVRTMPVPTPMISGLRTDRASTAYNLLNDRH
jgi:hypothetical protein